MPMSMTTVVSPAMATVVSPAMTTIVSPAMTTMVSAMMASTLSVCGRYHRHDQSLSIMKHNEPNAAEYMPQAFNEG